MPLPPGLALNPVTGVISGTPTVPGVYNFTLRVRDSQGNVREIPESITVAAYVAPTLTGSIPQFSNRTVAYSGQFTRNDGTAPFVYSISSGTLPTGITINTSTGEISGTPTDTSYTDRSITVRVVDASGSAAQVTQTIRYADVMALSGTLASGVDSVAYSSGFTRAGGHSPYTFAITAGSLPSGLSINSTTGVISGTPAGISSNAITVGVTDAAGVQATRAQTLSVTSGYTPVSISGAIGNGAQNVITASAFTLTPDYSGVVVSGGDAAYSYSWARLSGSTAVAASAPASLATAFGGNVAPGANVSATFRLTVTDGTSSATIDVVITATNTYVVISISGSVTSNSQNVNTLSAFAISPNYAGVSVSGGSGGLTYAWARTAGSTSIGAASPSTLATNFSGTIAPSGFLSSTFRLTVSDAFSSATLDVTISVTNTYAALGLSTPLGTATRTVAYSVTLVASGGTAAFTYALVSGSLPAGLSLASGGAITGTPTDVTAGTRSVTFRVTDGYGATADYPASLPYQLFPALSYSLGNAMRTRGYTSGPTQTGGHGSGTYALISGTLPTGITLNASTGVLSGTPTGTSYGTVALQIRYTDTAGNQITASPSLEYRDNLAMSGAPATPAYNGSAYSSSALSASGGFTPYAWSIVAGALPGGLSIASGTGVISGTPSGVGTFNFTVRVADAAGFVHDVALSIITAANVGVSISPPTFNYIFTNSPASMSPATRTLSSGATTATATATGGSGGYTYSWVRQSGSVDVTANNSTAATTGFTGANVPVSGNKSATFRCTATDSGGRTGFADVVVTIEYDSGL